MLGGLTRPVVSSVLPDNPPAAFCAAVRSAHVGTVGSTLVFLPSMFLPLMLLSGRRMCGLSADGPARACVVKPQIAVACPKNFTHETGASRRLSHFPGFFLLRSL